MRLLGLAAAWRCRGWSRPSSYGVPATDPASCGLAALLLLATGLVAAYLPAWRAAAVDPMVALRAE